MRIDFRVVVIDGFLPRQTHAEISSHILARESEFHVSQVTSKATAAAKKDLDLRRSRVIAVPGPQLRSTFIPHLRRALIARFGTPAQTGAVTSTGTRDHQPSILDRVEVQLTASGDGDFYGLHADGGPNRYSHRDVSFVYFLRTEPGRFTGGELRLEGTGPRVEQLIDPVDNRLVMFPSRRLHEIKEVRVPSLEFRHSRFTVNGWISLAPREPRGGPNKPERLEHLVPASVSRSRDSC